MPCVMIVLVELSALVAQINDLHFLNTTYIYEEFNGSYICVLIVRVQKSECMIQNVNTEKSKCVLE